MVARVPSHPELTRSPPQGTASPHPPATLGDIFELKPTNRQLRAIPVSPLIYFEFSCRIQLPAIID